MRRQKLENLQVWVLARFMNANAYKRIRTIRDPDYRSQMKRSALSVPSNIAEGHGRNTPASFILFLNYAQGSIDELTTQFLACVDVGLLNEDQIASHLEELDLLSAKIHRLIEFLRRSPPKTDNR